VPDKEAGKENIVRHAPPLPAMQVAARIQIRWGKMGSVKNGVSPAP